VAKDAWLPGGGHMAKRRVTGASRQGALTPPPHQSAFDSPSRCNQTPTQGSVSLAAIIAV